MAPGLKNRAVLVNGLSKGIGRACASVFLGEGGRVAIMSRERAHQDKAAQLRGDVVLVRADLSGEDKAARMVPMDGGANPVI